MFISFQVRIFKSREKDIVSKWKRLTGLCPLTLEEVVLVLQALGFGRENQIYIATRETFGGKERFSNLSIHINIGLKRKILYLSIQFLINFAQ